MKTATLSINQATALSGAIQELSQTGEDKKPVFSLPFKFSYACARTLTKLQEALKPIQEKNAQIFDGWNEENQIHLNKIKELVGETKDRAIKAHSKAFKIRNDKWKKISEGLIEVEVYEFPKFTDEEKEAIFSAGLTPVVISQLEPMNFCLDEAA